MTHPLLARESVSARAVLSFYSLVSLTGVVAAYQCARNQTLLRRSCLAPRGIGIGKFLPSA